MRTKERASVPSYKGSAALVIGALAMAAGATVYMKNDYASIRSSNEEGVGFRYDTDGTAFVTYRIRW